MKPAFGTLRVYDDLAALSQAAVEYLCDVAGATRGPFRVALSGGSTPRPMYERFARSPAREHLPWDRIHWIMGDERFVPQASPDSNFGMAQDAFLSGVDVPDENVHPVETEGDDCEAAALRYEATLKAIYGSDTLLSERPLIDFNILGLGPDGHTASLLPGQPVLQEHTRWVACVPHGRQEPRITLTYPALNSSRVTAFLVAGAGKREMLHRVLSGDTSVPAGRLSPVGDVVWFVDRDAAGRWA